MKPGVGKPKWAVAWVLDVYKPTGADSFSCLCYYYYVWDTIDLADFNKDPKGLCWRTFSWTHATV